MCASTVRIACPSDSVRATSMSMPNMARVTASRVILRTSASMSIVAAGPHSVIRDRCGAHVPGVVLHSILGEQRLYGFAIVRSRVILHVEEVVAQDISHLDEQRRGLVRAAVQGR